MTLPENVKSAAARLRLLVLDVDGVLTDGRLHYSERGETIKVFHVRDGLGIRLLQAEGVEVAVISGRRAEPLELRLRALDVAHAILGRDDKRAAFDELLDRTGVSPEEVAYVGDDVLDLPVMRVVALPIAVADAHPVVRAEASWVTERVGGDAAVREVADGILEARVGLERAHRRLLSGLEAEGSRR